MTGTLIKVLISYIICLLNIDIIIMITQSCNSNLTLIMMCVLINFFQTFLLLHFCCCYLITCINFNVACIIIYTVGHQIYDFDDYNLHAASYCSYNSRQMASETF